MEKCFSRSMVKAVGAIFLAGAVGCGGTTSTGAGGGTGGASGGGGGVGTAGVGVTIVTPVDIPTFNLNNYDFVGTNTAAALSRPKSSKYATIGERLEAAVKTKFVAGDDKKFSEAFCNQKQCLIETLRQAMDVEAFLCFVRAFAKGDPTFGFGSDGKFNYYDVTLSSSAVGGDFDIRVRMKKSGNDFTGQICHDSTFFEELVINQTTLETLDGIRATVTHTDPSGLSAWKGQFGVEANCKPLAFFENAKCKFCAKSKFDDVYGRGNINFCASGGADVSAIKHTLEANFANGETGAAATLAFNVVLKSEWGAGTGATGASNVDLGSGGTYPPFSKSEFTSGNANDPIYAICPKADYYCDNPKFDENDPGSCPVVPAKSATAGCPISEDQAKFTECYSIEGEALEDQVGYDLLCTDPSVADHYAAVQTASTLKKNSTIAFSESWDCRVEAGAVATQLDTSGVDLTECYNLLQEAQESLAEKDCFSQSSTADNDEAAFCEADADSDGTLNCEDTCPYETGSDCAGDWDGDGVADAVDLCPFNPDSSNADSDGDGIGNVCESFADISGDDYDLDGVPDMLDNCMFDANSDQADADSDFFGDACDPCPNDPYDSCFFGNDAFSCSVHACDNDFDCQLFAVDDPTDVYETDNVWCLSGCCELF